MPPWSRDCILGGWQPAHTHSCLQHPAVTWLQFTLFFVFAGNWCLLPVSFTLHFSKESGKKSFIQTPKTRNFKIFRKITLISWQLKDWQMYHINFHELHSNEVKSPAIMAVFAWYNWLGHEQDCCALQVVYIQRAVWFERGAGTPERPGLVWIKVYCHPMSLTKDHHNPKTEQLPSSDYSVLQGKVFVF